MRRLDDTRAVSIAVTHVMTIGITAVLVVGLMVGAGTMLDTERESSAEGSLETIGERLASEIASVDRYATMDDTSDPDGIDVSRSDTDVTVTTSHQSLVAGATYSIEVRDGGPGDCGPLIEDATSCLRLDAHGEDVTVYVPMSVESDVVADGGSVTGGPIEIRYDDGDDEIVLAEGDS